MRRSTTRTSWWSARWNIVNGGAVYNYVMLMDAGAINIDSTSTFDNTSTGGLDIYNHGTLASLGTFINDGGVGVTNYGTLTGSIVNNGGLGFSLYQNATCTADISGSGQIVNDSTKSVTLTGKPRQLLRPARREPGVDHHTVLTTQRLTAGMDRL